MALRNQRVAMLPVTGEFVRDAQVGPTWAFEEAKKARDGGAEQCDFIVVAVPVGEMLDAQIRIEQAFGFTRLPS